MRVDGHGDAMHVGKMVPGNDTLMVWEVHEDNTAHAEEMHNALTGHVYWYNSYSDDNGRGMAADIDSTSPGYEMWSMVGVTRSCTGSTVYASRPGSVNFRVYWDGDLYDELLDGTKLDKWTGKGTTRLASFYNYPSATDGVVANNSTKATPSLVADLFGDWREEVAYGTANADSLIVFTTTIPTPFRMYTLMHDPEYRDAISWQNTAYNQPPHLSFLLSDKAHWPVPKVALVGAPAPASVGDPSRPRTDGSSGTAVFRVRWTRLDGSSLGEEEQALDRLDPHPVAPRGLRGIAVANLSAPGLEPRAMKVIGRQR